MAETKTTTKMELSYGLDNAMPLLNVGVGAWKTITEWNAPDINYELLSLKKRQAENQAKALELNTSEQANSLMQQFNQAVGSYQYGTARRNVKVGEGSSAQNIESSSRDLGMDIQKMKGNTKFKTDALRAQADMYGQAMEDQKAITQAQKIGGLFDNIAELAGVFGTFKFNEVEEAVTTKTNTNTTDMEPSSKEEVKPKKPIVKEPISPVKPEEEKFTGTFEMPEEQRTGENFRKDVIYGVGRQPITINDIKKMTAKQKEDTILAALDSGLDSGMDIKKIKRMFSISDKKLASIRKGSKA